tara:strand:- start:2095 stop:3561 length:1467 start_codon:yes stop_codon:yes gene_type:complete
MKTTTGSFGTDTQMSNSLVTNMLKYPEISSTLIQQYPRYALTYLLERTGRFADVKILGDKSFEWKVLGRSNRAITAHTGYSIAADTSAAEIVFVEAAAEGALLSVHDVVMDSAGNVGQVTHALAADASTEISGNKPAAVTTSAANSATGGYGYKINFANGHAAISVSSGIGVIGTSFGEASLGTSVSEYMTYPDTYKNWLTLNRRKLSISGSALTDVTWIENNGSKLWYFTAEKLFTDEFMYQLELQRWFGRANVAATDADDFPGDSGSKAAADHGIMGDGILAQIEGTISQTYDISDGLSEDDLASFIAKLSRNAQSPEGNEYVVFTGTEGRYQFHKAMKGLTVGANNATGGSMQSMKTGSDVALGVNYTSYNVLGSKLTIAYCPVFDDVNVHGSSAAGHGGTMSGKMVFLDFSSVDGVPNIQLVAKGHDGHNRNYVKKYIPGMVNPYDQQSMLAANGDDSFTCQIMSESGIIVRNPLSCGILGATA